MNNDCALVIVNMSDSFYSNGVAHAGNENGAIVGDPGPLETLCFDIYQDLRARLDLPHSACTAAMNIVFAHIYNYELPLDKRRLERIVKHDLEASQNCQALLHQSTDAERAVAVAHEIDEMQLNKVHEAKQWNAVFSELSSLCEKMNPFWVHHVLLGQDDDLHVLRNLVDFRIHIPLWNIAGCEYLCYSWCRILRTLIEQQQKQLLESARVGQNRSVHDEVQEREAQLAVQLICDKLISYSITNEIVNDINALAYRHYAVCRRRPASAASSDRQIHDAQRCESRGGGGGRSASRLVSEITHQQQSSIMPNMQLYSELLKLAVTIYSLDLPASSSVFFSLEEWNVELLENLLNDAQCLAAGGTAGGELSLELSTAGSSDGSDSWREMAERIFVLLIAVHDKAALDENYEFPLADNATTNSVVMDSLAAAAAHVQMQLSTAAGNLTKSFTDVANDSADKQQRNTRRDSGGSWTGSSKRDSLASDDVYIPIGDDASVHQADDKLNSSEFGAVLLSWFNRRYNLRQHHVASNGWLKLCRFLIDIAFQPWLTYLIHANDLPVFIDICKRHVRNNPVGHQDRVACLKMLRNLHRNLSSSNYTNDDQISRCVRKVRQFFEWLKAQREMTKDSPSSTEIDITQSVTESNVSSSTPSRILNASGAIESSCTANSTPTAIKNEANDAERLFQAMRTTSV